jgi:serine/threonine protein kinase
MKLDSPVPFEQRYDLRRQLWLDGPHGGWLALDRILGREVNLPYGPEDDQRFLQIAQTRARLRHANLVPLYDLGATKDGKPFFTEPYIPAMEIRKLRLDGEVKAEDVTLPRLVGYLLDACKAVAFVHANGYVYLGLHPGNLLVVPESQEAFVVCGDPSLPPVRVEREGAGAFAEGCVCAVPAYMAPEHLDPERLGTPNVLTDVYGLGGILFEILYENPPNGRQPTPVTEILNALATRKGPPGRGRFGRCAARCLELARGLETVCLRALDTDRTARPASVSAFMKEIEQCAWGWAS